MLDPRELAPRLQVASFEDVSVTAGRDALCFRKRRASA